MKNINRVIAVFMLVIVSIMLEIVPAQAFEAFEIDHYNIEIIVNSDNSYDIVETIETNFSREKQGIFRTIPTRNNNGKVLVEDIRVEDHQYEVNKKSGYTEIKIGTPGTFISGKQTYVIKYHYVVGSDGIKDYDEFYFNIIGTEWDTYINSADFKITMPQEFDSQQLNFTSGSMGSVNSSNVEFKADGRIITGKILSKLRPHEGVTVALPLPEGYYTNVKDLNVLAKLLKFSAYIVSLLLIAFAFINWKKFGKDRELFAPVQFYPPQNMTSSEIGYIIDGVVDKKDITSLIILWASKGYLKIVEGIQNSESDNLKVNEKTQDFTLVKIKNADTRMRIYEQHMFTDLFDNFGDGTIVTSTDLKNKFYETVNSTQLKVKHYFSDDKRLYTAKSKALSVLFHFLALMPALMILLATNYPDLAFYNESFMVIALIIGGALLIDLPVLFAMKLLAFRNPIKAGSNYQASTVIGAVISAVPSVIIAFLISRFTDLSVLDISVMITATVVLNFIAYVMPKRTEYGNICSEGILGFKDFLLHAEKPRLEALVEENPEYYYNTMAYALVLGVSDKWAKKFNSIAMEPPNWYHGHYPNGRYTPMIFQMHMIRNFNNLQSSMTSAPAPKAGKGGLSSFGGGSVGGGSGGGGGGSW